MTPTSSKPSKPGTQGNNRTVTVERGAGKVAAGIAGLRTSSVNYAEVVSHFVHAGMPEREMDAMLAPLALTVVAADKALAQIAGRFRAVTVEAGLRLGNRFCLALAFA